MKTQETCVVWDDEAGGIETKQIVKRYSSMAHKKLKASTVRPKGMEGTGSAVSCDYNFEEYYHHHCLIIFFNLGLISM